MSIYKPNTSVSKYYSILFALPNPILLIIIGILLNIVLFFLNPVYIIYAEYYVALLVVLYVYTRITDSVLRPVKRIAGLGLVSEIYALITGLFDWRVGLVSAVAINTIVILGIDGTCWWRYIVPVAPSLLVLLINGSLNTTLLMFIVFVIVLDAVIYFVMGIHKINKYRSPDIGTMYLKNYLARRNDIEKMFEDLGEDTVVKPRLLISRDTAIIYTDLHYGPFSNIGSSMLPTLITEKLGHVFEKIIVLHGMGSHDRNLVSYNRAITYVEKLYECLEKCTRKNQYYYGSFRLKGRDGWDVLGVVFSNISLLFISRDEGIDDLPYYLQLDYSSRAEKLGLGDLLLIDCHNHELETKDMDIEALKELLDESLNRIKELKEKQQPYEIQIKAYTIKTKAPGVIGGRLTAFQIISGRDTITIVYIPGNNMQPGLREKIKSILKTKHRIEGEIEILTNDEHAETGTKSIAAYIPVLDTEELLADIEALIDKLMLEKPYPGLSYTATSIQTRIMGKSAEKLLELLKKSFPLSAMLLISYVIIVPALLYIFEKILAY